MGNSGKSDSQKNQSTVLPYNGKGDAGKLVTHGELRMMHRGKATLVKKKLDQD